jgi:hypothetical protein
MQFAIDTFSMERFGLVTGSKCSVMFPLRGEGKVGQRTYAKTLANEMYFQFYDEKGSWQTEHGKMAEFFAFIHYEKYISANIEKGGWKSKGDCGGTTDAELPDRVIDFKSPTTLNGWLDYIHNPLDKEQVDQLQMYMYLTGKPLAEIAAYLIETQFMSDNGLTYPVPEEKRMIIVRVEKDPTWEGRLKEILPSIIAQRDEFMKRLKMQFEG